MTGIVAVFHAAGIVKNGSGAEGFAVGEIAGLVYNPLDGSWRLSARDLDMNYLIAAERAR